MYSPKAPMGLKYYPPAPALRRVISSYYIFHADLPHVVDHMRADLPQIRLMLSGQAFYKIGDEDFVRAPEVTLVGPTYTASRFDAAGPLYVFGIGLQAAGWTALIREDASQYANRVIDAEPILGGLITDAIDAMRMTPSTERMVAVADAVMRVLFTRASEPPHWFTTLADVWLTHSPSPEIDRLIRAAGLSGRQVERLTQRIYGATPKMLARKYRALKAASEIANSELDWREVTGDVFYDQSHFIREIKQFMGTTPTQMIKQPTALERLTRQRRLLVGRVPKLTAIT